MQKIESYFGDHKRIIDSELMYATKEVLVAVAWINFKEYFEVFSYLINKKVKLKIVCTGNGHNRSNQDKIDELKTNGAEIKMLDMPNLYNHMHHKFAIIDQKTVLNGSFNWSLNAPKSFENLLVIKGFSAIVTSFLSEFNKIFSLEKESIKSMQKIKRCKENGCDGERVNVLIFGEEPDTNHVAYGDIVEVCTCCDKYVTLESCIPDTQLYLLLTDMPECNDDNERELVNRVINQKLDSYTKKTKTPIHAIGWVRPNQNGFDPDIKETMLLT